MPLNVVTRAQARKEEAVNPKDIEKDVESSKSVKTKSAKRALRDRYRSQYHKKLKVVTAELSKAQEQLQQKPRDESIVKTDGIPQEVLPERVEPKEFTSGGSVLADKHCEPLDAIMKAYEARLEQRYQTQENKWKTYPDAELEKSRLEMCMN